MTFVEKLIPLLLKGFYQLILFFPFTIFKFEETELISIKKLFINIYKFVYKVF